MKQKVVDDSVPSWTDGGDLKGEGGATGRLMISARATQDCDVEDSAVFVGGETAAREVPALRVSRADMKAFHLNVETKVFKLAGEKSSMCQFVGRKEGRLEKRGKTRIFTKWKERQCEVCDSKFVACYPVEGPHEAGKRVDLVVDFSRVPAKLVNVDTSNLTFVYA